ncbi:hypothetical protein E2C01_024727 [Portunus trituberculatus]|uniref:Uncharacterized protein n=1 Tax=Portunus trituberculatus TaxID=210409 RepID=A0A5B7ED56_PORTR|nr:hypothetical protein [Portunus trituberculatus]
MGYTTAYFGHMCYEAGQVLAKETEHRGLRTHKQLYQEFWATILERHKTQQQDLVGLSRHPCVSLQKSPLKPLKDKPTVDFHNCGPSNKMEKVTQAGVTLSHHVLSLSTLASVTQGRVSRGTVSHFHFHLSRPTLVSSPACAGF